MLACVEVFQVRRGYMTAAILIASPESAQAEQITLTHGVCLHLKLRAPDVRHVHVLGIFEGTEGSARRLCDLEKRWKCSR